MERNRDPDPDRLGVIYLRIKKRDQLDQWVRPLYRYAHEQLSIDWLTPDDADAARRHAEQHSPGNGHDTISDRMDPDSPELRFEWDYLTGDPNRPRLRCAIAYLRNYDPAKWLIIPHARAVIDHRHNARQIEELIDHGVTIHSTTQGLIMRGAANDDPMLPSACTETKDIMLTAARHDDRSRPEDDDVDTENEGTEDTTILIHRSEYHGGRPPHGFEVGPSGHVVAKPGEYERICEVVQKVKDGVWSKATAADKLGCARSTISNCLDRPHLYQLE